jgi:hypothetical protein
MKELRGVRDCLVKPEVYLFYWAAKQKIETRRALPAKIMGSLNLIIIAIIYYL